MIKNWLSRFTKSWISEQTEYTDRAGKHPVFAELETHRQDTKDATAKVMDEQAWIDYTNMT